MLCTLSVCFRIAFFYLLENDRAASQTSSSIQGRRRGIENWERAPKGYPMNNSTYVESCVRSFGKRPRPISTTPGRRKMNSTVCLKHRFKQIGVLVGTSVSIFCCFWALTIRGHSFSTNINYLDQFVEKMRDLDSGVEAVGGRQGRKNRGG